MRDKSLAEDDESFAGYQFRMSELQGAFLLAQLRKLQFMLGRCGKAHRIIREALNNSKHFSFRLIHEGDCGICLSMKFAAAEEASAFSRALAAGNIHRTIFRMC